MWKHVKSGTIPPWVINRWADTAGHEDPRKEYRMMTIVNAVCSGVALSVLICVAFVLNTVMSNRTVNTGVADMIAPTVIICVLFVAGVGYLFMRKVFENEIVRKTGHFENVVKHLINVPRPCLIPTDLVDEQSIRRAVESALTDLAARKIVFLKYEHDNPGSLRTLSDTVQDDLNELLDAGKELRILSKNETFTRFFAQASATRVGYIQREFDQMLAGLKPNEQPPLCW